MAATPNSRIVPKNLLVSATRATSDKAGVRLSDLFGTIKNDEPVRETDDED